MARKKVKLAWITNDAARRATFKKRRKGLMKKVSELSTLCGVNACVIVYGGDDSPPEIWPSQSDAQCVLNRYNNLPEMEKSKNMMNLESFLRKSITRLKTYVKKQQRDNKEYERTQLLHEAVRDTNALQGVGTDELSDLVCLVEETMKAIEERTDAHSKKRKPPSTKASQYHGGAWEDKRVKNGDSKGNPKSSVNAAAEEGKVALEKAMEDLQRQPWFMDVMNPTRNSGNTGDQMGVPYLNNGAWANPFPFFQ
ncbi:hypothetical protein GIB67_029875 [Kingdonia uniflora]|uniref:MADS-box domain-containing protein n=1 Tax=Kingdonia uniflora TaxID=39325 RepID=A0A7J7NJ87_9MAGN|nr:hypothetical protein GIB67_029875 [Kingdonia uniflora]